MTFPAGKLTLGHLLDALGKDAHSIALSKGFSFTNEGEQIALMHSELSEALEAIRTGDPESEKIPKFSCVEEEFADVILRILGFAREHLLDVPGAMLAKNEYNRTRPAKHGGKAF